MFESLDQRNNVKDQQNAVAKQYQINPKKILEVHQFKN